jgi:LPXTG-motif cell wall-anchored protein
MIKKTCLSLSLLFLSLFLPASAYASVLYMKPMGGNMQKGAIFPVQIRLSAQAESITSLSAYLSYPSDTLDVAYVKGSTSFPVDHGYTAENNLVGLTRENIGGVTGDVLVATIGFKPKVSNSTATISFADGSRASLADNTDTLDLDWTKSNVGKFNIIGGAAAASQTNDQFRGLAGLPDAGLDTTTNILIGLGLGSSALGAFGLLFKKKSSKI